MNYDKNKSIKKYRAGNITAAFGADLLINGATSVPNLLLKYYSKMKISDTEMMLLIQVLRLRTEGKNLFPTLEELSQCMNGDVDHIKYMLDNLLSNEVISIVQYYDFNEDKVVDGIDFEPLYEKISEMWACEKVREIEETKNILDKIDIKKEANHKLENKELKTQKEFDNDVSDPERLKGQVVNICTLFEREFARPLSPMEVDRIRHWLEETDPVLISEALRRAVMMGKNNFRYIDAILMEWHKNKLTTLQEIMQYDTNFQQRRNNKSYPKKKTGNNELMEINDERKKLYDALLMS